MKPDPRDDHLGVLLTAYADGSLHEDGCRFVEQQLEAHPELRQRLGEIGAAQELLRASLPPAPERLEEPRRQRVLRHAAHRPMPARRWVLVACAAVVMLAIAGAVLMSGTVYYLTVEPELEIAPVRATAIAPAPTAETADGDTEMASSGAFMNIGKATGGMSYRRAADGGREDRKRAKDDQEGASFPGPPLDIPADGYRQGLPGAKPAAGIAPEREALKRIELPVENLRDEAQAIAGIDLPAEQAAKEEENDTASDSLRSFAETVPREASRSFGRAGGGKRAATAPTTSAPAAAPAPSAPPPAIAKALPEKPRRSAEKKPAQAEHATAQGSWRSLSGGAAYAPMESKDRAIDSKAKADGKGSYLMAPERPALNFTPQVQSDLNNQLTQQSDRLLMVRNSGTVPLADGLLGLLGLPADGDALAVPFRLLVEPERPVRQVFTHAKVNPGEAVLHLANRNALQVVPMPGGFAVQAAQRPLDPTSTFGWPREDLRAAFGSAPMQAAAHDAQQTFAIDASTSSFAVARAALARGELPDPGQVEPQHLYNAVPADYPAPAGEDAFQLLAEAGPSPFASGPLAARTALVAIGVVSRPAAADERMPLDLVVAIDSSGSMGRPGGLPRARKGLDALLPRLDARDRVAVVAFGDVARVVQPAVRGDQHGRLQMALHGLQPAGATNLADGLSLACQVAGELVTPGRACRVLLITDGAALAGDAAPAAEAAVARWRGRGVSLLVVGCADEDYDGAALERLAQQGDGEHLVAGGDEQAVELFTGRLLPERLAILARDAKAQVTWNPERVAFARLIGFEKRRLTHEQFRDDRVDAGELAQDARATALFEIVLTEHGGGPLGTAAVRYHDTRLGRVVELSRALPGGLIASTASPRLRLLACAAELGETMQCGWWRNVRGPDGGRLAAELARIDAPFARVLADMERRYRALESQGQP